MFRGDPLVEEMANWIKQHCSNKFKMNTKDLDQRIEMAKYAEEQGINLARDKPKPKSIMEEVEEELRLRGEL